MPLPGIMGMPRGSVNTAGPVVKITPQSAVDNHYGPPAYAQRSFTLESLIGTRSSYLWSIIAGTGTVQSGQGTATASIRTDSSCVIRCQTVIGGITYNPEASLFYVGSSGGGELP